MKIGILTASRTNNYGTDLQAYAMQELVTNLSYGSVELINYKCEKLENSRKVLLDMSIKSIINVPGRIIKNRNHAMFRNKYFKYSQIEYNYNNLKMCEYNMIIVGSDQIWNLDITGKDIMFFLPFKFNGIKCSYAASLGKTEIVDWDNEYHIHELLSDFSKISVREHSGKKALSDIRISASVNLDPLLMINSERWENIIDNTIYEKDYILIYVVDRFYEILNDVRKIAKDKKLKIIVCGNPLKPIKGVKIYRNLTPEKWLAYMKNATIIVTNSYHGLSFAINFHKDFIIYNLRNKQSNTRLENLISLVGVPEYKDGELIQPNWYAVNKILEKERKSSIEYVRELVNMCNEKISKENTQEK